MAPATWWRAMLLVRSVSKPAEGSPLLASTRMPPYLAPPLPTAGLPGDGLGVASGVVGCSFEGVAVSAGLGERSGLASRGGAELPVQKSAKPPTASIARRGVSRKMYPPTDGVLAADESEAPVP